MSKTADSNDRREKRKATEDKEAKDNTTSSKKPRYTSVFQIFTFMFMQSD
jgi:hypothetical protein